MTSIKDERSARILFNLAPDMGPVRFQRVMARFGSALAAWEAPEGEWAGVEDLSPELSFRLRRQCQDSLALFDEELRRMRALGARALIPGDADFPQGLTSIFDPPTVLYIKGDWRPVDSLALAMVGTRRPTAYGQAAAERLARDLAGAGITLVSGLARGIDTVVHTAALRYKTRTLGVLGSGLGRFYPPENKPLMERMAAQGAVLSEFPMHFPPDRGHFPRRNRLISGLSLAVLVVEASEGSGSLITARLAAEQGRDVFAVPGPIFSKGSFGPHYLLKQGARLVESVEDILEEIELLKALARPPARAAAAARGTAVSEPEGKLLGHLGLEPVAMEGLAVRSGMSAAALSSLLTSLELKGLVRALPGRNYIRSESDCGGILHG